MDKGAGSRIITTLVVFVLSILLVYVGIILTNRSAERVRSDVASYLDSSRVPEQSEVLKKQFKEIGETNLRTLERSYPKYSTVNDLLPFINALENMSKEQKIDIKLKIDNTVTPEESQSYIGLTIEFKSTLPALIKYIESFQNLPYFVEIGSVSISDSVNIKGESTVTLGGKLYVRQEN